MFEKIWKSLSSTRLAIFMLILLTLVSVIGMAVPQGLPPEAYYNKLGRGVGGVLLFLRLDHLFSTAWFYAMLGVLSLNLLACIVNRLTKNLSASLSFHFLSSPAEAEALKCNTGFKTDRSRAEVLGLTERALRKLSFRVRYDEQRGLFAAKKGSLKDIGSLVFHCSMLVLFAGGLVGKFSGYSILQDLKEGVPVPVPDRSFLVRSDGFMLETLPDGTIKDYKSKLSLLNSDGTVFRTKTIEVNDPLTHEGIRFYQSSYGRESDRVIDATLSIQGLMGKDSTVRSGTFPFGQPVSLPGTQATITVAGFIGDFTFDTQSRTAFARSKSHDNPAIRVVVVENGDTVHDQWSFQRYPDVHMGKSGLRVSLEGFTPIYYTGIQVRSNPGVPLIWAGIILMTLGILAIFYISKVSLWVFVNEEGPKTTSFVLGGSAGPFSPGFQKEFDRICGIIRKSVEGGA